MTNLFQCIFRPVRLFRLIRPVRPFRPFRPVRLVPIYCRQLSPTFVGISPSAATMNLCENIGDGNPSLCPHENPISVFWWWMTTPATADTLSRAIAHLSPQIEVLTATSGEGCPGNRTRQNRGCAHYRPDDVRYQWPGIDRKNCNPTPWGGRRIRS